MDEESRTQLAGTLLGPWTESYSHVQGEPAIRWMPVCTIAQFLDPMPAGPFEPSASINLGLSVAGFWVLWWTRENEVVALDYPPGRNCTFLWPLLEGKKTEVLGCLAGALKHLGLSSEFLDIFPLEDLLISALESTSEGWLLDAVRWLESTELSPKLIQSLNLATSKGQTVAIRDAARTVLLARSLSNQP